MLYTIDLQGMEFHAFHGCYDLEQRVGNRFEVTLSITTELGGIAAHDAVEEAVNYLTVYEIVRERMAVTQRTIERVATNIIEALHARFPAVRHVRCTVAKLAPPLGGNSPETTRAIAVAALPAHMHGTRTPEAGRILRTDGRPARTPPSPDEDRCTFSRCGIDGTSSALCAA